MRLMAPSRINGTVKAPPSKSMTGRAIAAALLSGGTSEITDPSFCDDSLSVMWIAETLGAEIVRGEHKIIVKGNAGLSGNMKNNVLDCGESGLCMRMFAPIAGLTGDEFTLTGGGTLLQRPMKMVEQLGALGVFCTTKNGFAPIVVKGPITGGDITVDASISSQFLTGLLMALPLCNEDSIVTVANLRSRPYVEMTVSLLRLYGIKIVHGENYERFHIPGNQTYKPCVYKIEGDWSGAAFLLVAGAIGGGVLMKGLNPDSFQADKAVIDVLKMAGADTIINKDHITVEKDGLNAFEFDATDCPDLFPPLAVLASACKGKSVIYGADRLRHKESDRARALVSEFSRLGITIKLLHDRMEIHGGKVKGNRVDSHNDHRIAMACAVAALNGEGKTTIENGECVSKSYPDFFSDLDGLRVIP
ncbi:MAG: 3-phosphoshikimate 1-carboxyvinyltransferase [Proteobacteria bacterium]|nr:3-phosphoshikimate 1-carboxyvinyltransferase [Pseudomonadota bacterium]